MNVGKLVAVAVVIATIAIISFIIFVKRHSFSARDKRSTIEAWIAVRLRGLSIPQDAKERKNPIMPSERTLAQGSAHFSEDCTVCHAFKGTGSTEVGKGMYPPEPNLRAAAIAGTF